MECKFRSSIPDSGFELQQYQLNRYRSIQSESKRKVIIALGLGGKASSPDTLYLIPLDSLAKYRHIPHKYLVNYRIDNPESSFAGHISDWFRNEVFSRNN